MLRGYLKTQREIEFDEDERDADIWHERVWGVLEKLLAYNCQVVGIVESGQKLVYLNFVHYLDYEPQPDDDPEDLRDWTQDPHVVSDGGDHYWYAQYDPATGTFVSMGINGEA